MNGVPRVDHRGVPSFQDGIKISRRGGSLGSISSSVFGRCSSPGLVITILKPPTSDSLATLDSWMVESERARRCAGLLTLRSSKSSDCSGSVVGVDGAWLGVHDESCSLPSSTTTPDR